MKTEKITESVVEFFVNGMCPVYRAPFCEDEISGRLVNFAEQLGLAAYQCENRGKKNVVIYKSGMGKHKDCDVPVILQAHMDMVCVSSDRGADVKKVFAKGVEVYFDDAKKTRMKGRSAVKEYAGVKTTLGADDGIGVAVAFALLASGTGKSVFCESGEILKDVPQIDHAPIIAVFTVEEEDGMGGADAITYDEIVKVVPDNVRENMRNAKFINIDDECDGVYSVSCAGSLRINLTLDINREETVLNNVEYCIVTVSGLVGGHSGLCIHENRLNANIVLCDVLRRLAYTELKPVLFALDNCGVASNAIPATASALVAIPAGKRATLETHLKFIRDGIINGSAAINSPLVILASDAQTPNVKPYCASTHAALLDIVCAVPNGAQTFAANMQDGETIVETSCNLGLIREDGKKEKVVITCMIRSSVDAHTNTLAKEIKNLGARHGAKSDDGLFTPGWAYKPDNKLRGIFLEKYKKLFGKDAKVIATHAGLECGYFAKVLGDIDMISCGPQLTGVHGPDETLHVETIHNLMALLTAVLE